MVAAGASGQLVIDERCQLVDADERVKFEIGGGNFHLIVAINFRARIVFVKFLGTHAQYDKIDALTVAIY